MTYDALLVDACSIQRRTGGTFDPGTGTYGPGGGTTIYAGRCRVSPSPSMGQRVQVGEEAVVDQARWVFLPREATGVKVEDIVEVTASEDPDIIGRELTVKTVAAEPSPTSALEARWLICEDIMEGE